MSLLSECNQIKYTLELDGKQMEEAKLFFSRWESDNMKEFIEKLIGRLEEYLQSEKKFKEIVDTGKEIKNPVVSRTIGRIEAYESAIKSVNQLAEEYNNGWIPCSGKLPPQPEENPGFDNKHLELYLVSMGSGYPWRAFWNGEFFTDGWSRVDPKAWQPLPPDYKPKGE